MPFADNWRSYLNSILSTMENVFKLNNRNIRIQKTKQNSNDNLILPKVTAMGIAKVDIFTVFENVLLCWTIIKHNSAHRSIYTLWATRRHNISIREKSSSCLFERNSFRVFCMFLYLMKLILLNWVSYKQLNYICKKSNHTNILPHCFSNILKLP